MVLGPALRFPLAALGSSALCRNHVLRRVTAIGIKVAAMSTATPSAASGAAEDASGSPKPTPVKFGKWPIDAREVFLETKLSLGIVNLKPVVPGHVLIISRRVAPRFADLSAEEVADLWLTAQRVGSAIQPFFHATSLTFAIQDGEDAGQTVAHVHIHLLPRKKGDFANNDDIYGEIEKNEKVLDKDKARMDEPEERKPRTMEEMAEEAAQLRALLGSQGGGTE